MNRGEYVKAYLPSTRPPRCGPDKGATISEDDLRIVESIEDGNSHKATAKLLGISASAVAIAVRRVAKARGRKRS